MDLKERIEKYKLYLKITEGNKIARRYFIMNSFDGIVTILGVITGSIASGIINPGVIMGIGLSTAIAMAISGISGTFIAERAERELEIQDLEESMLSDLRDTIYSRAVKFTTIYVSIVDAISPLIASVLALIPIILSYFNLIEDILAIYLSEASALLYLFILGSLLSRLTNKNILIEGLKMMVVGMVTSFIIIFLFGLSAR